MRPYTRPDQDHGFIKYGNVAPNVFVDRSDISPTAEEINNLSLRDIYIYPGITFDGIYANPGRTTPRDYCDDFKRTKKSYEGSSSQIPYPPEYPGRFHRHELNEREMLWSFYVQARSILANHAPDALPHFRPPFSHPRDLTYCTNPNGGGDWSGILGGYYNWFHYALRTVGAYPYVDRLSSEIDTADMPHATHTSSRWQYSKCLMMFLPSRHGPTDFCNRAGWVPDEAYFREMNLKYYGKENSFARRDFIRVNRRLAGKLGFNL